MLICLEMVPAAIAHDRAFTPLEYAPVPRDTALYRNIMLPCSARMSTRAAVRDAFGIRDIVLDITHTLRGTRFAAESAADSILARLSSRRRGQVVRWLNRLGIRRRFRRSGRVVSIEGPGYYDARQHGPTGFLSPSGSFLDEADDNEWDITSQDMAGAAERDALLISSAILSPSDTQLHTAHSRVATFDSYGGLGHTNRDSDEPTGLDELDTEDENLYQLAKNYMQNGDYSYAVVDDEPVCAISSIQDPRGGIHTRIAQETAQAQRSNNHTPQGASVSSLRGQLIEAEYKNSQPTRTPSPSTCQASHPYRDVLSAPTVNAQLSAPPSKTPSPRTSQTNLSQDFQRVGDRHAHGRTFTTSPRGYRVTVEPGPPPES